MLESVSQADAHFSDISEVSDYLKHVDVESAGVASSCEENNTTDSDFGELTQHSPVPFVKKSPGFAAKDIEFQDFLRFVDANSSYTLSSAVNYRAPNSRFACQADFR